MSGSTRPAARDVFKTCQGVRVEIDKDDDIVITQERSFLEEGDHVVIIPRDRLALFIAALTDLQKA